MDPRLGKRVDPSDVVQDALAEAHRRLVDFAREPSLPFYPWLRQIAWNRLIDLHRRHIKRRRRSVSQKEQVGLGLSGQSAEELVQRLAARGTSPQMQVVREELRRRMRQALDELSDADREILVLRRLEQMPVAEIAATLGIAEGTVKSRHFRALEKLRRRVSDEGNAL